MVYLQYLHALELTELKDGGIVTRETAIRIHLTSNHYPALPESMVPVCIQAIEAYNGGRPDAMLELPEGIYFKGDNICDARTLIINCHLDPWLNPSEEF